MYHKPLECTFGEEELQDTISLVSTKPSTTSLRIYKQNIPQQKLISEVKDNEEQYHENFLYFKKEILKLRKRVKELEHKQKKTQIIRNFFYSLGTAFLYYKFTSGERECPTFFHSMIVESVLFAIGVTMMVEFVPAIADLPEKAWNKFCAKQDREQNRKI